MQVVDPVISDHSMVLLDVATSKPPLPKRTISFRNYKKISLEKFKDDIRNSGIGSYKTTSVDELLGVYNKTLTAILDKDAPLQKRTLTIRPIAPWFNEETKAMKAEKRKAERKWQRTHDDDDKKAFNELRTKLTNHIRECKKTYIQDKIKNAPQTQRGLFGCMEDLIYKPKGKALPTNVAVGDLPDIICEFFVTKIRKIQSTLNGDDQQLDSETDTSNPVNELSAFHAATEEEIEKIIKASPTKSCSLDANPYLLTEAMS